MTRYDEASLCELLDTETMKAVFRLYGIEYKKIAVRLGISRQLIYYKLKQAAFKPHEKRKILNILMQQYGMEATELMLLSKMINTAKKVKVDESN